MEPMKLRSHWLDKIRERNLLKVVEWAQRHDKPIEQLTQKDIDEALKAYIREASHASESGGPADVHALSALQPAVKPMGIEQLPATQVGEACSVLDPECESCQ